MRELGLGGAEEASLAERLSWAECLATRLGLLETTGSAGRTLRREGGREGGRAISQEKLDWGSSTTTPSKSEPNQ
jgi:hypothetical protein